MDSDSETQSSSGEERSPSPAPSTASAPRPPTPPVTPPTKRKNDSPAAQPNKKPKITKKQKPVPSEASNDSDFAPSGDEGSVYGEKKGKNGKGQGKMSKEEREEMKAEAKRVKEAEKQKAKEDKERAKAEAKKAKEQGAKNGKWREVAKGKTEKSLAAVQPKVNKAFTNLNDQYDVYSGLQYKLQLLDDETITSEDQVQDRIKEWQASDDCIKGFHEWIDEQVYSAE